MNKFFYHKLKVYYEDTDAGGVVYYANYLKYIERARTESLKTIGLSNLQLKDKFGINIIVKSCNIEYIKPAYLEDKLIIKSYIKSASKTSFLMKQTILKDEIIIIESQIHLVFVNEKGRPKRIPEIVFIKFKPYFSRSIKI